MSLHQETLKYGYSFEVKYSDFIENPCIEWCQVGTVTLLDRSRHDFGNDRASASEIQSLLTDPTLHALPIYLYEHSGVTIRTTPFSCPWDSGMVGVIHCTHEKAKLECFTPETVLDCLASEIKTLDQYLQGEVYQFSIYDAQGNYLDGCSSFWDKDYCIEQARSQAQYFVNQEAKQRTSQWLAALKEARQVRYWLAREIVTV